MLITAYKTDEIERWINLLSFLTDVYKQKSLLSKDLTMTRRKSEIKWLKTLLYYL